MRVSEKCLELNIGAELLQMCRQIYPKFFLRGLTQAEERREGLDIFSRMDQDTKVFAFQFKSPKAQNFYPECLINGGCKGKKVFRFSIRLDQHDALYSLASMGPISVFYVLPYLCCPQTLWADCPKLICKTWFLPIHEMRSWTVFGPHKTKTIVCEGDCATVFPEFKMVKFETMPDLIQHGGIRMPEFKEWYKEFVSVRDGKNGSGARVTHGLRIGFAVP